MEANDLLMGGGVKSATFPDQQYGTTVGGLIVRAPVTRQQTDFKTGDPKFFPNGDPMMQIVVQVQTDQRDPADPLDDGVRGLYLKSQMMQAVRDAVRAAGASGLEVGGHLAITYVRDEASKLGKGFDKKIYSAVYRQPTAAAWPQVAQASAPSAPAGVDPATWARMTPDQQQAVMAVMEKSPPF